METGGISEGQNEKTLNDELLDVLENLPGRENLDPKLIERQRRVIKRLPKDLDLDIRGALEYRKRNFEHNASEIGQIGGELFEVLVREDDEICPNQETQVGKEARAVMSDPARFNLSDFGLDHSIVNPDLARVNENGEFTGDVEVKASGKIDERAYFQLKYFRTNFENVAAVLKKASPESLRAHGLIGFADVLEKAVKGKTTQDASETLANVLNVSDQFKTTLAVPRDSVANSDVSVLVNEKKFKNRNNIPKAIELLKQCIIAESAFNANEIKAMREHIAKKLGVAVRPHAGLPVT